MSVSSTSVLRRVVDALDGAGATFAIVGSVAAASWGVVRATRDVDLVALVDAGRAGRVLDALIDDDLYVPETDARLALERGGAFNVLDTASGGKVDVFVVAAGDEFESMRLSRRVRMDVLGVHAWVATAEDIVLSKLRWRRESRSDQQWRDCVEIAATNLLDVSHLRRWAPVLGVADDLEELLIEVGRALGGR